MNHERPIRGFAASRESYMLICVTRFLSKFWTFLNYGVTTVLHALKIYRTIVVSELPLGVRKFSINKEHLKNCGTRFFSTVHPPSQSLPPKVLNLFVSLLLKRNSIIFRFSPLRILSAQKLRHLAPRGPSCLIKMFLSRRDSL